MARAIFPQHKQAKFLKKSVLYFDGNCNKISEICRVSLRTLSDWRREKYNMSYEAMVRLSKAANAGVPKGVKRLPEYWSANEFSHLGGRRFVELYGSPGTPKGRRMGGLSTQNKLRSDPWFATKTALKTRKKIRYPQKSPLLAEFVGIMLGDGGCHNDYQFTVSFNPKKDMEYAYYIQQLITKLFSVSSTIDVRDKYGSGDIIVNGRNLVEFLNKIGIAKGNKVVKQIDIPQWIFASKDYKIA